MAFREPQFSQNGLITNESGSLRHEFLQCWLTPTGQGAWCLLTICCFHGLPVPCNLDVKEGS